jgi:hypothetical protein
MHFKAKKQKLWKVIFTTLANTPLVYDVHYILTLNYNNYHFTTTVWYYNSFYGYN